MAISYLLNKLDELVDFDTVLLLCAVFRITDY